MSANLTPKTQKPQYQVHWGGEAALDGLYCDGRQVADWRDLDRIGYTVESLFFMTQAQLRKIAWRVSQR